MSKLPPHACRLRVRYQKDGRLAYLGHLELMETLMRSVRRSTVPFEVGNGFAKRMRIQFSQALPVGASSKGEYYDLLLSNPLDAEDALKQLQDATPALLKPTAAAILPRRVAALEAWANLSHWTASVRGAGLHAAGFEESLKQVLKDGTITYLRGDKPRTIRLEGMLAWCHATDAEGGVDLDLATRSTDHGSLRPAVLVRAVCGCVPLQVCREALMHEVGDGTYLDPMDQRA